MNKYKFLPAIVVLLALPAWCFVTTAQTPARKAVYLSYEEARHVLQTLGEILPPELKSKSLSEQSTVWSGWAARRDAEIRNRLAQGDEDSLINFLLFGTSYTKQPRVTAKQIEQAVRQERIATANSDAESSPLANILQARIDDLLKALATPGANDRLLFARRLLVEQKKYDLTLAEGRERAHDYLLTSLARVLSEQSAYARAIESARALGDTSEEFAERSKLYRARGLSSDTSVFPNFAIEEALKAVAGRGLLASGSVRRVAVIGPGLDFTDKQEGYDFYPPQTIQPFALIDSLTRLNLAQPAQLHLTTFDLSPRVNSHITRVARQARSGQGYVVQLPLDPKISWKPEALRYWERFGDRIASSVPPIALPVGAGELKMRALRVRPEVAARIAAVDVNVVLQHLELPPSERFDLIIATNIFVYYDTFEQSLAMLNVERMLRPGGLLLSNNALLELPTTNMRSAGYSSAVYSDRQDDGDLIVWYQRPPG